MVLLGAVILPHGAMPFDGDPDSPSLAVRERQAKLDSEFRKTLEQVEFYLTLLYTTLKRVNSYSYLWFNVVSNCFRLIR